MCPLEQLETNQEPRENFLRLPAPSRGFMDHPAASAEMVGKRDEPENSESLRFCFSQGLKELHHTRELCDATLVAGGRRFPCNRALLASVSPYFQAVFTNGFKESRDGEVLLKDMDPGILQHLLNYLYSGDLTLSPESAEEVFTAASRLQLLPALAHVSRYLVEKISTENCLRLYMLAHDHNNHTLLKGTLNYLGIHFEALLEHPDFPRLDLGAFISIISSDHLAVASEMDVFQAMWCWVTAKPSERLPVLSMLLQHLRFPLLMQEELAKLQADLTTLGQHPELQWQEADGAGRLRLSGGLRQGMSQERIVCVKVPRLRDILSVDEDMDCCMECLNPLTGSRTKLPPLTLVALPGCTALEHRLYISGGKYPNGTYSSALHEYDSLADCWLQLPAMSIPRSVHMLLACRQKLFALSGWNDTGPLASAESFDVAQQTWSSIASLPIILRFSTSVPYKNKLYLIGGDADSDEVVHQGILIYNVLLDTWTQVPLDFCLHGASAVALEAGICVIGGFFSNKAPHLYPNRRFSQLLPCTAKCFLMLESGAISKAHPVPPLPLPLAFAGATVFQARVYVMGGVCTSRTYDAIYHWEPGEAAWTQYPESLSGQGTIVRRVLKCVTLKVPKPKLRTLLRDIRVGWVAIGVAEPKVPGQGSRENSPSPSPPDLGFLASRGA